MNSNVQPQVRFSWTEIFPWTIIFRSLNIACSFTVITLALMGVVATPMGWIVSEQLFVGSEEYLDANPILAEAAEINRSPYRGVFRETTNLQNKLEVLGTQLSGPRLVFEQMVKPFYAVFGGAHNAREFLYYLLGSAWSLVVWSFVGLGITRVSLLKLTRNEQAGLDDAFDFAMEKFTTCAAALAMPLTLAFALCVPSLIFGLLLGFDFGALVVGIFWIVAMGIAFCLAVLLLGLMAGWPLIVASVAAEGQNSFDAMTRAYAYTFQRPVNYFCYALVAVLFGGICWLVMFQFTQSVVRLSYWSTSWGANRVSVQRMDVLKGKLPNIEELTAEQWAPVPQVGDQPANNASNASLSSDSAQGPGTGAEVIPTVANSIQAPSTTLKNARRFVQFWIGFAKTLAVAFIHGLFWCMASAIYLLLRKDVDEMEMDEIFLLDERRTYDLPPLQSDEHGIPQVQPLPLDDPDM